MRLPIFCPCILKKFIFSFIFIFLIGCDPSNQASSNLETKTKFIPVKGTAALTKEEILDPLNCQPCHPLHYAEWRASVHAYASEDPVFLALNKLGQEETDGLLGSFCVQCHAPIAVALGQTEDGLNLEELPTQYQGITCAYCHQVSSVEGTHNNPLNWEQDGVMRGGLDSPQQSTAHASVYSSLLDGRTLESSSLCGSCHDIVTPTDVHLERTFYEWEESIFSDELHSRRNSCGDCHMPSRKGERQEQMSQYHDHLMPAVDLVDREQDILPLKELANRTLLEEVKAELDFTLLSEVCGEIGVSGGGDFEVYLENVSAGHRFPSGAALDRRLWLQFVAKDDLGNILFSSGMVSEGESLVDFIQQDDNLWLFRDTAFTEADEETHRFWEISHVKRKTLPASTTLSPAAENYEEPHQMKRFRFGTERIINQVEIKVFLRPIGLEILTELESKNLLPSGFHEKQPTFELGSASKVWQIEHSEQQLSRSGRMLWCIQ